MALSCRTTSPVEDLNNVTLETGIGLYDPAPRAPAGTAAWRIDRVAVVPARHKEEGAE